MRITRFTNSFYCSVNCKIIYFQYIHDYYGEDPALYNKACSDLDQLRQVILQLCY